MSAPAVDPPQARRFSDYTILEPIGSGLRGTVFRARNGPGRLVALKVFNPGVGIDVETLRRFSPHSDGGISHPNLVPVEAAGKSEGKAYCSMAFLPGDSLEEILFELRGSKRLKPHLSPLGAGPDGEPRPGFIRHAVALVLNVAEGLERAHRAGVIHGRLSPRNLILAPSGRLVVTDFGSEEAKGSARRVGGGASHDLKTLAYRAPEQIEADSSFDARADVYSLGAILFELLTRRPPFSGRDPRKVQEAILDGRFPLPSELEPKATREAEAVILRAMALDPAERYSCAGELAEDLRRLLRLEVTRAGAEGAEASAQEPEPQNAVEPGSTAGPAPAAAPVEPSEDAAEEAPAFGWLEPAPLPPAALPDAPASGSSPPVLWVVEPLPEDREVEPEPESGPAGRRGEEPLHPEPPPAPQAEGAGPSAQEPEPWNAVEPATAAGPAPAAAPVEPSEDAAEEAPAFGWLEPALLPPAPPGAPASDRSPPILWVAEPEPPPAPRVVEFFVEPAEPAPRTDRPPAIAPEARIARRAHRSAAFITTFVVLGAMGGWTWITLMLHEAGERNRLRAATFSTGLDHLEKATFAIFSDDPSAASSLVAKTRDLGIADPGLDSLESALRSRAEDPARSDLAHPRPGARRDAIAAISLGVEAGERPASDLAFLKGSLGDGDLSVRSAAIAALARGGSSAPLLDFFPIGAGRPALEIDSPTFLALARALADIADSPSEAVLLGWSFEDFGRLDETPEEDGKSVALPPNLRIALAPHAEGEFALEWIRGRGRLRSEEVLGISRRLARGDARLLPLAPEIIDALPALGEEAARDLFDLAAPLHLTHGPRIIAALSSLGAHEELLGVARGTLPGPLRALAVSQEGAALSAGRGSGAMLARAKGGLVEILRRDPEPEVRRAALGALREIGAVDSAGVIAPALWDPALREEALDILKARPLAEALPVLLEVLRKGDAALRCRAAEAIGALRDPSALAPLGALLFEDEARVRSAALKAMREISPCRALILAAGVLPPGSPEIRELALAAARGPLEGIPSPALLALAFREALGVAGADGSPLPLRLARRAILREQLGGEPQGAPRDLPARLAPLLKPGR